MGVVNQLDIPHCVVVTDAEEYHIAFNDPIYSLSERSRSHVLTETILGADGHRTHDGHDRSSCRLP
jgi:hypothetical protein